MKSLFRAFLIGALFVACLSAFGQDYRIIRDGIEYAEVTRKLGDDPVKINLLRLDLTKVRLDVHHAMDAAIGTEQTSSIATRHGAIAAINGGFFRLDNSVFAGDAAGLLIVDNFLLSEPIQDRISLTILNGKETKVYLDRTSRRDFVLISLRKRLELDGINRERKANEIVVYTPKFSKTTLTQGDGIEVTVVGRRLTRIDSGNGNSTIPDNGYVISATGSAMQKLSEFAKLDSIVRARGLFTPLSSDRILEQYDIGTTDAVGGVPQLIKNGKIDITWEQEKASKSFVETRHPRTAVAKLKDGKFLMITVDGRQPGVSVGMNLNELAIFLLELGAVDAMNLDGGGSTTMFLDGKVVNHPSDKEDERKVSDAILVTLRKKPPAKKQK